MTATPTSGVHLRPFGSYLLVRKVSSGGMADVYRARVVGIRGFSKTVAIKRIYPHLLERSRFVRMFTDEAKIAARLVHPNIVQIHELGEESGVPYIAMEYVRGRDLYLVTRRLLALGRRFPPEFVVRVVAELCQGLQHAHDFCMADGRHQEIVHRDVSPRNVLLGFDGEVKLTDFGVARARDREEHTEHGLIKGKVRYLSPEAAAGAVIDRRSDLFSLGVVMAEMLTMRALREGPSDLAILLSVRAGELDWERLREVPVALRGVLNRALAVDPEARFPSAEAFGDALLTAAGLDFGYMDQSGARRLMRELYAAEIDVEHQEDAEVDRLLAEGLAPAEPEPAEDASDPPAKPAGLRVRAGVRQTAKVVPQPKPEERPSSEGDLVSTSLARVMHGIAAAEANGRLDLHRDPVRKSIFFEDGDPSFAVSNVESELFGEHLVGRGALSRQEHSRVLDRAASEGISFSEALLKLEVLPPHQLYRHLAEQVRDRVLDLFTWSGGRYAFFDGVSTPPTATPLGLRTYPLIHAGVNECVPLAIIHRALEGARNRRAVTSGAELPLVLQLAGREQRILRALANHDGNIDQVVRLEKDDEPVLRLLYLMQEIEYLRLE
jgi:serine/threonine-protein kinase